MPEPHDDAAEIEEGEGGSTPPLPPVSLGPETAKYLDDNAASSFKRQIDLEESIWRSLPLLTGALAAASALIAAEATSLPPMAWKFYQAIVHGLFALAILAFAASFWWLWQIVRPRLFDYPPDDAAVAAFAHELAAFHRGEAPEANPDAEDKLVLADLRSYMTESFSKAARSTFANNLARLSARSQVLVLLLCGFVLSFAGEAVIYGHRFIFERPEHGEVQPAKTDERAKGAAPLASPDARDQGRGLGDKDEHVRANQEQIGERQKANSSERIVHNPTPAPASSPAANGRKAPS